MFPKENFMRLYHYKKCISALPLVAVFAWGSSLAQTRPEVVAPAQAAQSTKTQPAKIGIRVPDSERNVKASSSEVAQARFEAGQKSLLALQYADAIEDLRAAIEVAPDFIGAHLNFITASVYLKLSLAENKALLPRHYDKQSALTRKTMPMPLGSGPAIDELLPVYEAWAQKWKSEPAVLWGLGKVLIDHDHDRASQLFNQVLEIDSNYAMAWRGLAALGWQNKNQAAYGANLKKATTSDPSNPDFAMEYNSTLRASDSIAYQQGLKDIVARFPRSAVAYIALNFQLGETKISEEKQAILQQMRRDYPNEDYTVHYFNMLQLYGLIAPQNPEQALEILKELQKNFPVDKDLDGLLRYQEQMIQAHGLISEKNYADAARSLVGLTLPRRADAAAYHLLLAEAVGAGDQEKAYQSLLAPAATPDHNLVLVTALQQLGKKLNKTPATIEDDLWTARVAQASIFKEFELIEYKSGKTVKLSDYRGKVVLVNFWFPACGPCLNEFPLVQEALKRYGSEGFVVLAINIIPDQDAEVLPLLEAKGFDFIPLKVPTSTWPREQYSVNAAPMNFLLDAQGRLIFKPKIADQSTQSRFFGEIESMLKHR
jgi:thiol-disulfide isomerase/thioredoxin/Tfp pilus assembly protein PilF